MKKEIRCKICGNLGHYKTFCFSNENKKPIKSSSKPIKKSKTTIYPYNKPKRVTRDAISKQSDNKRKRLVAEADRVFSLYIRQRNSQNGLARCVTCGVKDHWQNMQNGHYISRKKLSTRYDEINCNVQCKSCNEFKGGNLHIYKQYLITKYGQTAFDNLVAKSNRQVKLYINDLEDIIAKYGDFIKKS